MDKAAGRHGFIQLIRKLKLMQARLDTRCQAFQVPGLFLNMAQINSIPVRTWQTSFHRGEYFVAEMRANSVVLSCKLLSTSVSIPVSIPT